MTDQEFISCLYILSATDTLRGHINSIFNFETKCIKLDCLESGWQTSGSRSMTLLAFNLFNGFIETKSSPTDLFASLDESNENVCIEAIKLRFNIGN